MTATSFHTNDPRTIKDHSKRLIAYALQDMFFVANGMAGEKDGFNPNAVLMIDSQPGPGDTRTYEMEKPLSGTGQGNDGTVVNNEEAGVIENMSVALGERSHAVRPAGKMSLKRTDLAFDQWATRHLGLWTKNVPLETDIMAGLYGLYNASGIETVNELEPSANRIVFGGGTVAGVVSAAKTTDALLSAETAANYLCNLPFLSTIRRKAEMATPKIIPITVNGSNYYPVLLHPYQVKSIRQSTGETGFNTLMKDAERRGKDNPIFKHASFLYDGLIIFSYDRAPMRTGAGGTTPAEGFYLNAGRTATTDAVASGKSVAAGILLGSHAGVLLWGQKPKYYRTDLERGMKRAETDMIYAIKKTRFNVFTAPSTNTAQEDYGCLVFHTQVIVD